MAVFLYSHIADKELASPSIFPYEATDSIYEYSKLHDLMTSQRSHPKDHRIGISVSIYKFWGDTNIKTIAGSVGTDGVGGNGGF